MSAKLLGIKAVIAMPIPTPAIKVESVRALGAQVILVGDAYDDAEAYARDRAKQEGMVFIPPFDDPDVIAGQGTVGMEVLRQRASHIHAIFVPIGGGGLIAGIAAYVKRLRPEIRYLCVYGKDGPFGELVSEYGFDMSGPKNNKGYCLVFAPS